MEIFLIKIRVKALAFAVFRVKNEDIALDIVQDTMIGFVKSAKKYDDSAWKNLFYKILTRRVTDWQRKTIWRNKLRHFLSVSQLNDEEQEQYAQTAELSLDDNSVESHASSEELYKKFELALQGLPARQQEAYLLRQWQGNSTEQTAQIMQCSQGSVKTHFSRAMQQLRKQLGEWINER